MCPLYARAWGDGSPASGTVLRGFGNFQRRDCIGKSGSLRMDPWRLDHGPASLPSCAPFSAPGPPETRKLSHFMFPLPRCQPKFTGPSDHRLIFDTINKLNIPPFGCFSWVSYCSSHAKVINTDTLWLIILTLLYDRSQKSLFNWCIKPRDAHLPIPGPHPLCEFDCFRFHTSESYSLHLSLPALFYLASWPLNSYIWS